MLPSFENLKYLMLISKSITIILPPIHGQVQINYIRVNLKKVKDASNKTEETLYGLVFAYSADSRLDILSTANPTMENNPRTTGTNYKNHSQRAKW